MTVLRVSRRPAFYLTLALGIAASAGAAQAQGCPQGLPLTQAGKLTMSINATIPPKQYIDSSGKLQGLHVELGNEIAKRLCLEPVYQNVQFEVQVPGLQNKRWDVINSGLFFTEARTKTMRLIPFSVNALAVIVAPGNPLKVTKPEDLAGRTVGTEIAGFEERKLREIDAAQVAKGLKPMNIKVFNNYGDVYLALRAGQIEAVFSGDAIGTYYQEQGKFTKAATGLFPGTPGAFATIEPKLADAIVAALNAMMKDGTYQKIMDAFGTTKIDAWSNWKGMFEAHYTGS